jgi:hypothetical protein
MNRCVRPAMQKLCKQNVVAQFRILAETTSLEVVAATLSKELLDYFDEQH